MAQRRNYSKTVWMHWREAALDPLGITSWVLGLVASTAGIVITFIILRPFRSAEAMSEFTSGTIAVIVGGAFSTVCVGLLTLFRAQQRAWEESVEENDDLIEQNRELHKTDVQIAENLDAVVKQWKDKVAESGDHYARLQGELARVKEENRRLLRENDQLQESLSARNSLELLYDVADSRNYKLDSTQTSAACAITVRNNHPYKTIERVTAKVIGIFPPIFEGEVGALLAVQGTGNLPFQKPETTRDLAAGDSVDFELAVVRLDQCAELKYGECVRKEANDRWYLAKSGTLPARSQCVVSVEIQAKDIVPFRKHFTVYEATCTLNR